MIDFVFISGTSVAGHGKNRWKCIHCYELMKQGNRGECRFNLAKDKINIAWKCKFCKRESFLRLK